MTNGVGLFTIIMQYRGGTYIFQTEAKTPSEAARLWAERATRTDLKKYGLSRRALRDWSMALDLVRIRGARNVWCEWPDIGGHPALINIVATCSSHRTSAHKAADAIG